MFSPSETSADSRSGRSLLRSVGWMTGSNLIAQVFAYGSLVLLARWLDPASFGTIAVASAFVGVAVLFVDQGTWGAVIVERRLTRLELARAFRRCMAMAILLAALMAATSGNLVEHFAAGGNPAAFAAMALCLPLHAIAVVPTALIQRSMQFRRLAGVNGVANVGSALLAVVLALGGAGVWALVIRQLVLYGLIAVLAAVLCAPALRAHTSDTAGLASVRTGVRTEWWFFLFSVIYAVTNSLDKLVVGHFGSASVVGFYAIAATIAMAPWTQFSAQAGQVLFAAAASQRESFAEHTVQSVRLMSLLMLPLLPVGILVAPAILPAALGPEWAPVVVVFQILLIVGVGNAIVTCIAEPITGIGYMPFRTRIMIAQLVATAVALWLLVPQGGIRGAAVAQLIVFVPYAVIYFTAAAHRAGTSARALLRAMRPAFAIVTVEAVAGLVVLLALVERGVAGPTAACWAALIGLVASMPLLVRALTGMRAS